MNWLDPLDIAFDKKLFKPFMMKTPYHVYDM